VAEGAAPASMPPKLDPPPERADTRTGILTRIALLVLALLFQILSFVALFVFVHVLRGHYEGSTYSTAQQIDAAVLGLPGVALGIGALLAALYTLFTGRRARLVSRLALASLVLLAVAYGIEVALK
jgi:hypothetical protein